MLWYSSSRTLASRLTVRAATAACRFPKRLMAGMPVPQSSKAKLFEGHPRNEGWEFTMLWFYSVSAILIVGILGFSPETSIEAWARQEAMARLKLKEAGMTEFEFGKHYQDHDEEYRNAWDQFSQKAIIQKEVDDDDEDDEDDEDEDEEDDE